MIRVWIAAPGMAMRIGLNALLQGMTEIQVAGESSRLPGLSFTGDPPVLPPGEVDVLLLVGQFDLENWPAAEGEILPAILLLDDQPQAAQRLAAAARRAAAWGILSPDCSPEELEAALKALAQGLVVASPALLDWLLARSTPAAAPNTAAHETLTAREREVLQALAQGLANKQLSLALGISEHTVKFHVSAIYSKLGATNRTEAVRLGVQQGLISVTVPKLVNDM